MMVSRVSQLVLVTLIIFAPIADSNAQSPPVHSTETSDYKAQLSADEYIIDLPGPPPGSVVIDPKALDSHGVTAADYPAISVRLLQQGAPILKYLVASDGHVADVQILESSGFPRLDEAAIGAPRRWKFSPGTVDGAPTAMWQIATLTFEVFPGTSRPSYSSTFCHSRPFVSAYERPRADAPSEVRWALLQPDGKIGEALRLTELGWVRLGNDELENLNSVSERRHLIARKDNSVCWISLPA